VRRSSVAIIGLGLVGGSLARALTRRGYRVTGIDWPLVVRRALATRAISRGATRAEAAVRSDLVVLAAPPATNLRLLRRLAKVAPPGLVLTDVSSVKRGIVSEAARLGLRGFVGGHPMAGTEKQGFAASKADLFRGATWWLVPSRSARANRSVRALVRDAGARPVTTDPATHDRVMAFLSHAPQLVAWALVDAARGDAVARRHLRHAGPGFRGMTRLARSPRALWNDILAANRVEVARALRSLRRSLERRRR
jgi:prephenate dehydrogenase